MFKLFFLFGLLVTSSMSFASPLEQMISIKERLRISLWVEGLEQKPQEKSAPQVKNELPEEIERSLRKL
jgi:hypothetical protein